MEKLSFEQSNFLKLCLENDCRGDGRCRLSYRPLEFAYGVEKNTLCNSNGSCVLRIPDTQALLYVSAKAELGKPKSRKEEPKGKNYEGKIELHLNYNKNKDNTLNKSNFIGSKLQNCQNFLQHGLIDLIDLKKLCLVEGSLCWIIHLDIFIVGCDLDYNHLDY